MRFYKKEIGKLFIFRWVDAYSEYGASLNNMIKNGLPIKTTTGWLDYFCQEYIIITTEKDTATEDADRTMIPKGWVIEKTEVVDE